jgi:hypothetical protein
MPTRAQRGRGRGVRKSWSRECRWSARKCACVTVEPLGGRAPAVGEIVLVRCRGHEYLHLVKRARLTAI